MHCSSGTRSKPLLSYMANIYMCVAIRVYVVLIAAVVLMLFARRRRKLCSMMMKLTTMASSVCKPGGRMSMFIFLGVLNQPNLLRCDSAIVPLERLSVS